MDIQMLDYISETIYVIQCYVPCVLFARTYINNHMRFAKLAAGEKTFQEKQC